MAWEVQRSDQKYGISDPYVLRSWIKSYTSGKDYKKATSKGMRRT